MKDEKKAPKLRFKGFTDDWEQCKLGDVAEITAGGDINKGDLINKGKYPVIANGLNNNGIVGYSNKYKIDAPAVTITGRGTLGVATARFINFTPIVRLISVKSDLDPIYLENAINNTHFVIESTGVPQLTAPQVKRQKVILSNCHIEQTKIGSLLSTLDHTITLHEEKEHQLEQLKSALLQKMFADKSGYPAVRFEGFDEVWKHQKFSDIVKGLQNNTLSRSELNYECGTVKNIHYGDILTKFGEFIDASKTSLPYISDNTKADKFEKSFLKDGDIVIADTAEDDTVGKCVEIQGSEHLKISAGLHTIACRPKQQYGSKYLGYYFNSPVYHNQLHPLMQGIKVTSISKSSIQNTDVYIPQSVAEQSKIGDVLSKIDSLISLNQREVKKLSIIKQSLLQKMFI